MRITERQLRWIIKEELNEDLAGFMKRTGHISYNAGGDEWSPDTTFINEPENRALARDVKRAWAAEADHDFMRSLVKIHWVLYSSRVETFMGLSRRNEISAKGYLPRVKMDAPLGGVGFIVQGRVTLAANSQDTIYSGMSGRLPPETHKYFAASGTPKRARNFNSWMSRGYMLDRKSFSPSTHNELIVDNWKPVGIVITPELLASFTDGDDWITDEWAPVMKPILESGLPIYDISMKSLPPEVSAALASGGRKQNHRG
jgi:hypothetical protein